MSNIDIFILIDALGSDLVQDYNFLNNDTFHSKSIKSLFGFSSACLPTIYTGLYPDEHLRWGMWHYKEKESTFRRLKLLQQFPEIIIRKKPITRYLINEYYKKYSGINEYYSLYNIPLNKLHLYDLASKRDLYRPNAIPGVNTIFDHFKQSKRDVFVADWRQSIDNAFADAITHILEGVGTEVVFIYLSDLDALLHKLGPIADNIQIKALLKKFELSINEILDVATQKDKNVNIQIFSDHGMSLVNESIDLQKIIRDADLQEFSDFVPFYDSTMARFNYLKPDIKNKIECILNEYENFGKVLTKDQLKNERVYFEDHSYGETIFVLHHGFVINPSMVSSYVPKGMHGYLPDHSSSNAVLISNKKIEKEIAHIIHFYQMIINQLKL